MMMTARGIAFVVMLVVGTSLPAQTATKPEPIAFVGPAQPIARLRVNRAVVFDSAGKPLFTGDEDYIRAYARNPTGRVQAWDTVTSRIRLSSSTHETWLNCTDVEPMAVACTDITIATSATGGIQILKAGAGPARGGFATSSPGTSAAIAIPNCPGSKLCPKL